MPLQMIAFFCNLLFNGAMLVRLRRMSAEQKKVAWKRQGLFGYLAFSSSLFGALAFGSRRSGRCQCGAVQPASYAAALLHSTWNGVFLALMAKEKDMVGASQWQRPPHASSGCSTWCVRYARWRGGERTHQAATLSSLL